MGLLSTAIKTVGFLAKNKKARDMAIKIAQNPTVKKAAAEAAKKVMKSK